MAQANARLAGFAPLLLAQRITQLGWRRGSAGLTDRPSRPHRSPRTAWVGEHLLVGALGVTSGCCTRPGPSPTPRGLSTSRRR